MYGSVPGLSSDQLALDTDFLGSSREPHTPGHAGRHEMQNCRGPLKVRQQTLGRPPAWRASPRYPLFHRVILTAPDYGRGRTSASRESL